MLTAWLSGAGVSGAEASTAGAFSTVVSVTGAGTAAVRAMKRAMKTKMVCCGVSSLYT